MAGSTALVAQKNESRQLEEDDHFIPPLEVDANIEWMDLVCVIWFTGEYILRIWASPHTFKTLRSAMSIIDVLSILPFYVELLARSLCVCSGNVANVRDMMLVMRILRVLRIFRVLRVLKLARYSIGIQLIGRSLKRSLPELIMLSTFVFICTILFSTVMYYLECDYNPDFYSIPQSGWWCIITFTTVGYGDVTPITAAGKVMATVTSFVGVVILAFPISIIVEKFSETYARVKEDVMPQSFADSVILDQNQEYEQNHEINLHANHEEITISRMEERESALG